MPGQGVPVPSQSELPSQVLFCLVVLAQNRGSVSSEVVLGGFFWAHDGTNSLKAVCFNQKLFWSILCKPCWPHKIWGGPWGQCPRVSADQFLPTVQQTSAECGGWQENGAAAADPTHAGASHLPLQQPYLPGRVLPSFPRVSRMTWLPTKAAVLEGGVCGQGGNCCHHFTFVFQATRLGCWWPLSWERGKYSTALGGCLFVSGELVRFSKFLSSDYKLWIFCCCLVGVVFGGFLCVFFFPLDVSLVSKLLLLSLISAYIPFLLIGGKGLVETKGENSF